MMHVAPKQSCGRGHRGRKGIFKHFLSEVDPAHIPHYHEYNLVNLQIWDNCF